MSSQRKETIDGLPFNGRPIQRKGEDKMDGGRECEVLASFRP